MSELLYLSLHMTNLEPVISYISDYKKANKHMVGSVLAVALMFTEPRPVLPNGGGSYGFPGGHLLFQKAIEFLTISGWVI